MGVGTSEAPDVLAAEHNVPALGQDAPAAAAAPESPNYDLYKRRDHAAR